MISLDDLINEHWDLLVDGIVKDAIRQIPSYGRAPIQLTVERVERWLRTLADSIAQNEPHILADYLAVVGKERKEEGYTVQELHAIISITEHHLGELIDATFSDPVEHNGQMALLTAVMDSARMVLSVSYVLNMASRDHR